MPAEPVVLAMVIPPPVYAETRTLQSESEGKTIQYNIKYLDVNV